MFTVTLNMFISFVMSGDDMQRLGTTCVADGTVAINMFIEPWEASDLDMEQCVWALIEATQQENEKVAVLLIEHKVSFSVLFSP
jgi:ABC-type thiamine transport system ATPase subunit